ncbi:hypothetical protein FDUTEX481_09572 [Tolypothrix sp. PCC 7601]|nr:hypothetical protein FDUTEX481_09572 [Tolypothrix sp. PCC 7601]
MQSAKVISEIAKKYLERLIKQNPIIKQIKLDNLPVVSYLPQLTGRN